MNEQTNARTNKGTTEHDVRLAEINLEAKKLTATNQYDVEITRMKNDHELALAQLRKSTTDLEAQVKMNTVRFQHTLEFTRSIAMYTLVAAVYIFSRVMTHQEEMAKIDRGQ